MQLRPWQEEALTSWQQAGCRGIVEAFPGAGKTIVGIEAVRRLFEQYGRFLVPIVVVPSVVIMEQWRERFRQWFPGASVGVYYAGKKEDYSVGWQSHRVIIAVINSIVRPGKLEELLAHVRRSKEYRTMLVADECHHYIHGRTFGRICRYPFSFTMGLSATAEQWQIDGIGENVCEYTFKRALEDRSVPRFHLVNIAADFLPQEAEEYHRLGEEIGKQIQKVRQYFEYELRFVPSHLFLRRLQQISQRSGPGGDPVINRLLGLVFKRAALCYTAQNKHQLAVLLSQLLLSAGRKTIVFFERIKSAQTMAEDVALRCATDLSKAIGNAAGVWCGLYHSGIPARDRQRVLEEFRANDASILIACRGLDEGLDIPHVDAAILAASTQSQRQRIQRIGRVLRMHPDKPDPVIVTLYVPGSGDENVVAEDREAFEGVADIHDTSYAQAGGVLASLLGMHIDAELEKPETESDQEERETETDEPPPAPAERARPLTVRQLADYLELSYPATVQEVERYGQSRLSPDTVVYTKTIECLSQRHGKPVPMTPQS